MREQIENNMGRSIKFLLFFLVVFLPFRSLIEMYVGSYMKVLPDFCIMLLAGAFIIYRKAKMDFKFQDIIFICYLMVAFVNTVIINNIDVVIYIYAVRSIALYYVLYFIIRNFNFSEKDLMIFTKIIRYVTYALFVLGIVEKLGQKTIFFPASVARSILYADNYARVYGMFFNPNTYGAFLVLSFFIVLHINKDVKLLGYKIVVLTSLLMTMSRSSLLILVFVMGILILTSINVINKKKLLLECIFVLICSGMLYLATEKITNYIWVQNADESKTNTTLYDRLSELKDEEIVEKSSTDGRLFFLKKGIQIWKDNVLMGTGFGTYGSAASMGWRPPLYERYGLTYGFYADNEYIKDLVETGIVGLCLFFVFWISILWNNRKNSFNILMCCMVGCFGLFYNVFEVQIVTFLLWSYLGVSEQKNE